MKAQLFILLQVCLVIAYAQYPQFKGGDYQNQTAQQKMDQLWDQITADTTPYGWYNPLVFATIFTEDMSVSFDTYSDTMPDGRKKLIHSVGCVAQAELIAEEGSPYTGMFQGVSNVLVRVSTAKEADGTKDPSENFVPGMGIKLLRDGLPSANLVAMYSVDGQDSFNPFKNDWTNHIPAPQSLALQLLGKKFAEATPYIGRIGLKTWAQYDEKGNYVDNLVIPFKLIFRPTSDVNTLFPDEYSDDLTNQLPTIPAGTNLFDVYAVDQPYDDAVKVATIKITSQFTTSDFGDRGLFFQHNYIEDDIALHPDWQAAIAVEPPIMAQVMEFFHKRK